MRSRRRPLRDGRTVQEDSHWSFHGRWLSLSCCQRRSPSTPENHEDNDLQSMVAAMAVQIMEVLVMKHPNKANAYKAGHPDGYLPFGYSGGWDASDDDVEDLKDEEARIRHIYKGLDDPDTLKKIYAPSLYATATFIED